MEPTRKICEKWIEALEMWGLKRGLKRDKVTVCKGCYAEFFQKT